MEHYVKAYLGFCSNKCYDKYVGSDARGTEYFKQKKFSRQLYGKYFIRK